MKRLLLFLVVLGFGFPASADYGKVTLYNSSGNGCWVTYDTQYGGAWVPAHGSTLDGNLGWGYGWSIGYYARCDGAGGTWQFVGNATTSESGSPGFTVNASDCGLITGNPGTNAATYQISGCWTNNGVFPRQLMLVGSDNWTTNSPWIAPGGRWCVERSADHPWQYCLYYADANGSGDVEPMHQVGCQWAGTNSPAGGSGGHAGAEAPNNPYGTNNPNAPSITDTNLLDKGTFNKGVSNLINSIYGHGQYVGGLIGTGNRYLSNGVVGGGTNRDYSGVLESIRSNTAAINSNSALATPDSWEAAGSNFASKITLGISNEMMVAQGNWSNWWGTNVAGMAPWVYTATQEIAASSNGSIWELHLGPAAQGRMTNAVFSLNPRNWTVWHHFVPWVRLAWYSLIMWFGVSYVKSRMEEEMSKVMLTPGSAANKTVMGYFLRQIASWFLTVGVSAAPIILGGAISYLAGNGGVVFPWHAEGVAVAGEQAGLVQEGIALLVDIFPVKYAIGVGIYLWAYDSLLLAWYLGAARVSRMVNG